MNHLHQHIAARVDKWRTDSYSCIDYSAIAEVLEWAKETETGNLSFLRRPQLRALETYWYLRLIEKTPHIFGLYKKLFPPEEDIAALLDALGVSDAAFKTANYKIDRLLDRIKIDDAFGHQYLGHRLCASQGGPRRSHEKFLGMKQGTQYYVPLSRGK